MNCLILSVPVGTERRLEQRDWTKGLDTTSIHAAQSFPPNWRTAIRLLRGYEESARAPNPEIGLWRTVSRNLSLIINTIRWLPMRQFGEKTFDGNEKPRRQDPPGISAEPFAPLTFSAEPKFAAIILSLAASRLPKAERVGFRARRIFLRLEQKPRAQRSGRRRPIMKR